MPTTRRIAVAGATGRVGRHVVDVLEERRQHVVPMSRATGVDVITGTGLAEALTGVDCVIDVSTGPSPGQEQATEFFTAAARNLHLNGERAGVGRMVVVSIIGCDRFSTGYSAAKVAHERAVLAGPVPAGVLRAAQFDEFVPQLMAWGRQGDVCYVPKMRTQLVAARTVAEALVDLALEPERVPNGSAAPFPEIAGPRDENLVEMATLVARRWGEQLTIEGVHNSADPEHLEESGGLLPSPHATLAGPTFEEWLDSVSKERLQTTSW